MVTLVPMSEEEFPAFEAESTLRYADATTRAGCWPAASAFAHAQKEFRRQLPRGLSTPGHYIYNIIEGQHQQKVGYLWFAEFEGDRVRTGFIFDIHVTLEHRGHGYAKAALALIEKQSVARGLTSVELHVLVDNAVAQALYRSLGYGVTGFHMLKPLRGDGA